MIEETWKWIPGYEGNYQASTLGNVRSFKTADGQPRMLKKHPNHAGYIRVSLSKDGKRTLRRVHHLVLETYIGPKPAKAEGGHLNGDRADNSLLNLKWVTKQENTEHKYQHGSIEYGTKARQAKFTEEQIKEIRRLSANGASRSEVARCFGTHRGKISRIINNQIYPEAVPTGEKYVKPETAKGRGSHWKSKRKAII